MPAQRRRSSRLTERRCSLQSLDDLESSLQSLVLDDQPHQPRRSARSTSKEQQQQQPQQPRRSKRIQEQNAKKQSLLPSSPVSTIDTPFSTSTSTTTSSQQSLDLVPEIMASSSIITPMKKTTTPGNKTLGVRFGTNSVAKFSGCDPATVIQRLSLGASQQLFPHEGRNDDDDDDEEPSLDNYDDETKQNCHILAQWDDSFDELDQSSDESDDDDDETIEADNSLDEGDDNDVEEELPTQWRDATLVIEEEEEIFDTTNNMLTSPHVSHRSNALSRLTKRVDEYFCKSCGLIGMRRTTRYVYGEEN